MGEGVEAGESVSRSHRPLLLRLGMRDPPPTFLREAQCCRSLQVLALTHKALAVVVFI